jgi:hypothetical protein
MPDHGAVVAWNPIDKVVHIALDRAKVRKR